MSDILISGIAADGYLRVIGAETTKICEDARVTHNMSATATAALGRMLTGTVLMAKEMKNETEPWSIQLNLLPSKNYKDKEILTCSLI